MNKKLLVSTAAAGFWPFQAPLLRPFATTGLNLRAGPGPQHKVVGTIGAGQSARPQWLPRDSKWCVVAYDGVEGWVYSDYLTSDFDGNQVVLTQRRSIRASRWCHRPPMLTAGATGAVTGGVTGCGCRRPAGPVGAIVGGGAGVIAGGAAGTIIDPPEQVRTYVTSNEVERSTWTARWSLGAGLPETVELRPLGRRVPVRLCERPARAGGAVVAQDRHALKGQGRRSRRSAAGFHLPETISPTACTALRLTSA